MDRASRCPAVTLAVTLMVAGGCVPALFAAGETELKDETGKTIVSYIVEAPANTAPAGTTDPARQVGVIFCFQEHTSPPGADIFPVRESLKRLGLSDDYVLLAIRAQTPAEDWGRPITCQSRSSSHGRKRLILSTPAASTCMARARAAMWPANSLCCTPISSPPPSLTVGAGGPCPPSWISPSIMVNSAPEFYMVLGMRDFTHHITTVRDTYERVKAKGYHVIYREFEELGDRSYHPTSNDDAIALGDAAAQQKHLPLSRRIETARGLRATGYAARAHCRLLSIPGAAWAGLRRARCSKSSSYRATPASGPPRPRRATTVFLVRLPPRPWASCLPTLLRKCAMRLYAPWHPMPTGVRQLPSRS